MRITLLLLFLPGFIYAQDDKPTLLIPYRVQAKWGYADTLGRILIHPEYDSTTFFNEESQLGIVYKDKKMGIVDGKGQVILKPDYNEVDQIYPRHFFRIVKDKKSGMFNSRTGKIIIPLNYSTISYGWDSLFYITSKEKQGVATMNGKIIVPPAYDNFIHAENLPEYKDTKNKLIGRKGKERFLIDMTTGKTEKIKGEFEEEVIDDQLFAIDDASHEDGRSWKLYNRDGYDSIVPIWIVNRGVSYPAEARLLYKQGQVGIEWSDRTVIPPSYDKITAAAEMGKPLSKTFIAAYKNGKAGIIDKKSTIVAPFIYDELIDLSPSRVTTILNNKVGMIFFFTVYPPIANLYDTLVYYKSLSVSKRWSFTILKVKKDGKMGYVGENGVEYFK